MTRRGRIIVLLAGIIATLLLLWLMKYAIDYAEKGHGTLEERLDRIEKARKANAERRPTP